MRTLSLTLVLGLVAACGEKEPVDSATDADGDGYFEDEDCDDNDAAIHPGAEEICDGVDNNCDDAVDEGVLITVYGDADGDGYGVEAQASEACAVEAGQSEQSGDCNDDSADIYPGAPEEDCADPIDYNCDGVVEYEDNDGDGFAACEDCDDASSDIHPDADELCDNVDNNCDGEVDEDSAVDALTFYADLDFDGYGDPDNTWVACAAPSGYVADNTDCDDDADGIYPGAEEICDAADSDCDGVIGEVLVPTDYSSVQAAIDAGEPWICVDAGTYSENLAVTTDSDLTLEGVGADQVFLDGGGVGKVLEVTGGDGALTLSGLTIQNGWADDGHAGGLYLRGNGVSALYAHDLIFTGNSCEGTCYGAAAYVHSYDAAELVDVEAHGNSLNGAPFGSLSFWYGESLTLDGVSIHDELLDASTGTGYALALLVQNNSTDSSTGYYDSVVSINDLEIYDNSGASGGSVYSQATFYRVGTLDITNASVWGNSFETDGFCVTPSIFPFYTHTGALRNVELVGNSCRAASSIYASGLWLYGTTTDQGSSFAVENLIVAGNSAEAGSFLYSGWILDYYATTTYTNVSVHGNSATAPTAYAGWMLLSDSEVTLNNVDVSGNSMSVTDGSASYASGFGRVGSETAISFAYSNLADLGDTPYAQDITDPTGTDGVISGDPGYADVSDADPLNWDLSLSSSSALIDAGDPSVYDADGSTSDIGAFGGPYGADW